MRNTVNPGTPGCNPHWGSPRAGGTLRRRHCSLTCPCPRAGALLVCFVNFLSRPYCPRLKAYYRVTGKGTARRRRRNSHPLSNQRSRDLVWLHNLSGCKEGGIEIKIKGQVCLLPFIMERSFSGRKRDDLTRGRKSTWLFNGEKSFPWSVRLNNGCRIEATCILRRCAFKHSTPLTASNIHCLLSWRSIHYRVLFLFFSFCCFSSPCFQILKIRDRENHPIRSATLPVSRLGKSLEAVALDGFPADHSRAQPSPVNYSAGNLARWRRTPIATLYDVSRLNPGSPCFRWHPCRFRQACCK